MNSRLLLALGLSLALHAALGLAIQWSPLPRGKRPSAPASGGGPLRITLSGGGRPKLPPPTRQPRAVREKDYIPANVDSHVKPFRAEPDRGPGPPVGHARGPGASSRAALSGGGKGGKGGGLLSTPAAVRRVVYLVDRSASMGPSGGLDRALDELRAALKSLPPGASFQVLLYNQGTRPLLPPTDFGLVSASPENVSRAVARLVDVLASGTTNHLAAFQSALYLRPEVLFLITDADDLSPTLVRSITALNRSHTQIHVVELTQATTPNAPLADLAHFNGGWYRRIAP